MKPTATSSDAKCDVLIVDNGTNYLLFGALAQHLQDRAGLSVVFTTLVPARAEYFGKLGIEARLLDLSHPSAAELSDGRRIIERVEKQYSSYRIGISITRDRILRWYPQRRAEELLMLAGTRYTALLKELQPKVVLGEISWAIEHLFFYISEAAGVTYRHIINLPGKELLVTPFDVDHSADGTGYLGQLTPLSGEKTGMSYYELCGQVQQYRPTLRYFLRNFRMLYSLNDYRQSLFYRVRRVILPLYSLAQHLFELWYAKPVPAESGHVLMVLHVQPEATPDYVAPFFADQVQLAERLSESLKYGQHLYVKDHPNVTSLRNLWSWARLLKKGKVRLLRRRLPGRDLLNSFQVVFSIAGTALYEASRLGIPAVSMSRTYLNGLPNVIDGRAYPTLAEAMTAAENLRPVPLTEAEAQAFLAQFGVPAFIHDARISPGVTNTINIRRLAGVVLGLLQHKAA